MYPTGVLSKQALFGSRQPDDDRSWPDESVKIQLLFLC